MKKFNSINFTDYKSGNGFINHYQTLIKDVVVPFQYEILNDRIEGAEKSHVIQNFINAGKVLAGEKISEDFYGMVFQDSDAAKWLEAAAGVLSYSKEPELEAQCDALIKIISEAQDKDGYLNTRFTISRKEQRWTNLLEGHELYCAGHMMEAAEAYYRSTGKTTLLDVMNRNVECIYRHFITENNYGYPGHPEVELALLKMYRATENPHALELAQYFINQRGEDSEYFEKESKNRFWTEWGSDGKDTLYNQSALPVRKQKDATGHAVRAVYLYTAMADCASVTDDEELIEACRRLWDSITKRRMYITGGIGSTGHLEAFTTDYNLPNDTAYCETCASIGLMMFASRMLETEADSKYADVMERAFYNTVLAGMQLDGKRFFYVNPLEMIPGTSGVAVTHKHVVPQRPSWYACACCPPNVARTVSEFGKYAFSENENTAICNLYAEGNVTFANGMTIECRTEYPFEGTVDFTVTQCEGKSFAVRIPDWSRNTKVFRNGKELSSDEIKISTEKGYIYFNELLAEENITLEFDMSVNIIHANPKIPADNGKIALQRGPLVYCAEGNDNQDDVLSLSIYENEPVSADEYNPELLGGTVILHAKAQRILEQENLYSFEKPETEETELNAIPYFQWGNRNFGQMCVWLNRV